MLFQAALATLTLLQTLSLSAIGPIRSVFEVWAIADNIYCCLDSSIKPMQFTASASYASRWRHKLLLLWKWLFFTWENLEKVSNQSASRLGWLRWLREDGLLLLRRLGPGRNLFLLLQGSGGQPVAIGGRWLESWFVPSRGGFPTTLGSLRGPRWRHQVLSTKQNQSVFFKTTPPLKKRIYSFSGTEIL